MKKKNPLQFPSIRNVQLDLVKSFQSEFKNEYIQAKQTLGQDPIQETSIHSFSKSLVIKGKSARTELKSTQSRNSLKNLQ